MITHNHSVWYPSEPVSEMLYISSPSVGMDSSSISQSLSSPSLYLVNTTAWDPMSSRTQSLGNCLWSKGLYVWLYVSSPSASDSVDSSSELGSCPSHNDEGAITTPLELADAYSLINLSTSFFMASEFWL